MNGKTFEVPCARCVAHPGLLAAGSPLLCRTCGGTKVQRVSEKTFLERYGAALEPKPAKPTEHILVDGYRAPERPVGLPAGLAGLSPSLLDRLSAELMMEQVEEQLATEARAQRLAKIQEALLDEEARTIRRARIVLVRVGGGGDRPSPPSSPAPPARVWPEPRQNPPMHESRRRMLAECREMIEEGRERLDRLLDSPEGQEAIAAWRREHEQEEPWKATED